MLGKVLYINWIATRIGSERANASCIHVILMNVYRRHGIVF